MVTTAETVTESQEVTVCDSCGQAQTPGLDEEIYEVIVDPHQGPLDFRPHHTSTGFTTHQEITGVELDLCTYCLDTLFGSEEYDGVFNDLRDTRDSPGEGDEKADRFQLPRYAVVLVLAVVVLNVFLVWTDTGSLLTTGQAFVAAVTAFTLGLNYAR